MLLLIVRYTRCIIIAPWVESANLSSIFILFITIIAPIVLYALEVEIKLREEGFEPLLFRLLLGVSENIN